MKRVAYIGGQPIPSFDRVWGGSLATNYCFQKAFQDDHEYFLDILPRDEIRTAQDIMDFCDGADIVHLDDTGMCGLMFTAGLPTPDVIGPITRSPVKDYKGWECCYSEDWFYKATVIRLNYAEERMYPERVRLVTHGVDTKLLKPDTETPKKWILWAGARGRYAKNYGMWNEIRQRPAPDGFEYMTLSGYTVQEYWDILKETAVVVCTSRYESFCNCAFEAMACGVPVVWRDGLQGGLLEAAGVRVGYEPEFFNCGIRWVCNNLDHYSLKARKFVEDHNTLEHMRDSYASVYSDVLHNDPAQRTPGRTTEED